jgi:prepilin-type N-terminal cleavage/methylation domain-containing protein
VNSSRLNIRNAFTLVEVLIAMMILAFLLVLLTSFLGAVSRAWNSGEQQVGTFQDGRAILDVIGRELSQAAISPSLQLITNPAITDSSGNSIKLTNSNSIFWQAPLNYRVSASGATPLTNLCEVGYYLVQDNTQTGANIYQLRRFFVPPSDTTNYKIFATTPSSASSAAWVTNYARNSGVVTNTIATGVVALWVRCLDSNGGLIPWAGNSGTGVGATDTAIQFNSAAHFQPAILGTLTSFVTYTASSTAQAHSLPNAVELTLVMVDDKTLRKGLTIPGMPHDSADRNSPFMNGPADVPNAVAYFNNRLIQNHVSSARTFTAQIAIPNSFRQ